MAKRLTQEDVISAFKDVHGDTYDYSKVVYSGSDNKVLIICKDHGDFYQSPYWHKKGQGCNLCGYARAGRLQKEESSRTFVSKANKVHNGKYTYENVVIDGMNNKVSITCPVHGDFLQSATDHTMGHGCKECRKDKLSVAFSSSKECFIKKARETHGELYSYDNAVYVNSKTKLLVTCRVHGDFDIVPSAHIAGNKCRFCNQREILTTEKFIEKAESVHGAGTYFYTKVDYLKSSENVIITCPKHGDFSQIANSHLQGAGCGSCSRDKLSKMYMGSKEDFVSKCSDVHNDKNYDYSKVEYNGNKNKVEVVCPVHGSFFPAAGNHLAGSGCPSCSKSGFSTSKAGVFYVMTCGDMTKVGITNLTAAKRAIGVSRAFGSEFFVAQQHFCLDGLDCLSLETSVLREMRKLYKNPTTKFAGSSECFVDVDIILLNSFIKFAQNKIGVQNV